MKHRNNKYDHNSALRRHHFGPIEPMEGPERRVFPEHWVIGAIIIATAFLYILS